MCRRPLAGLLACILTAGCVSAPPRPERAPRERRPDTATTWTTRAPAAAERIVALARSLLDTPYRYSGADRNGFDCSGLTSFLFRDAGVRLPRTAETQATVGHWVAPDELRPGDLVFFGDTRRKPHHVGLVVSSLGEPLTMIHASSSRGVIETEVTSSSYWLERLRFGRRVLPAR